MSAQQEFDASLKRLLNEAELMKLVPEDCTSISRQPSRRSPFTIHGVALRWDVMVWGPGPNGQGWGHAIASRVDPATSQNLRNIGQLLIDYRKLSTALAAAEARL